MQPIWSELGVRYRELLLKNGLEATSRFPYAFANFSNGQPIEMSHRKHYYDAVVAGTTSNLPPFFRADVGRKSGILARWRTPTQ